MCSVVLVEREVRKRKYMFNMFESIFYLMSKVFCRYGEEPQETGAQRNISAQSNVQYT